MPSLARLNEKTSRPGIVFSRRAIAGWVFVLFLVSGWMFGMGVMVGRGTAPVHFDIDQLRRTLDSLQKNPREPQKPGTPGVESPEMKDKTKLDFYEMLPKNKEDSDLPNLPAAPPVAAAARPAAAPQAAPAAPKPAPAPAAAPAAPTGAAPPAVKPAPAAGAPAASGPPAAATPARGFTVQVSAVKSEDEARRILDRLRQRGYAGYVEPVTTPDRGTLYRVRMGEFPSKEFARSTLERLQKDGIEAQVVPK